MVSVGYLEEVLAWRASQVTQLVVRPSDEDPTLDQTQIALARMPPRALLDIVSALSRAPDERDVRTMET